MFAAYDNLLCHVPAIRCVFSNFNSRNTFFYFAKLSGMKRKLGTTRVVKMAEYWPTSFSLRVYGPTRSQSSLNLEFYHLPLSSIITLVFRFLYKLVSYTIF